MRSEVVELLTPLLVQSPYPQRLGTAQEVARTSDGDVDAFDHLNIARSEAGLYNGLVTRPRRDQPPHARTEVVP
jgi:hypothetical protein